MNKLESQERKLYSTIRASPLSSCHHQHLDEEQKIQEEHPLRTLAARMLMMSIMKNKNSKNEEARRVLPSPPRYRAPEEEKVEYHHHQHSSHSYRQEHQISHEVPSTPPPRPFIWQSEMDMPMRRALIREM